MSQNEEEAWFHHVLKEFEYAVNSHKYGPLVYDLLSVDTKIILNNMYTLAQQGRKMVCT
jgi:hypothetical protein